MSTRRFIDHDGERADEHDAERRGQVAAEDGVDGHEAEAVDVEDALGDHRAADEQRDVEAEHGHDRRQARAQAVAEDHAALGEALGAGRAYEVLAEGVEQAAADHAGVGRRVEQGEHDPGQDQVRGPLPRRVGEVDVARAGREFHLFQNRNSAIRPSQKTGAEMPKSAKPMAARSMIVRRLTAERTPMLMPMMQPDHGGAADQRERARRLLDDLVADRHARAVRVAEAGPAVLVARDDVLDELRRTACTTACRGRGCGAPSRSAPGVGCRPAKRAPDRRGGSR